MATNKKLNLEELKELVFNKNQATKQNKDKLFKLAKSNEDIETIEKLANEFSFKNAIIYLNKKNNISLEVAITHGDFKLFKKLVEDGKDISTIKVSELITKKCNDEFIKIFIEQGFSINIAQLIKMKYKEDTVKLALENGANIDDTYENLTGLFYASMNQSLDTVSVLLSNNVNINKKSFDGHTPLSIASQKGFLNIVEILLDNNANPDTKDNSGVSPIELAMDNLHFEVSKLLLSYGVKPKTTNIKTFKKNLDKLVFNERFKVVKLIPKYAKQLNENIKNKDIALNFIINLFKFFNQNNMLQSYIKNSEIVVDSNNQVDLKDSKDLEDLFFSLVNQVPTEAKLYVMESLIEIIMQYFLLGRYSSNLFSNINNNDKNSYKYKLILKNQIDGKVIIHIYDSSLIFHFQNKENVRYSDEYKLIEYSKYYNQKYGYIMIINNYIIEKPIKGGRRISDFIMYDDFDNIIDNNTKQHMPKELVKILSNFRKDNPVKFTTHDWDGGFMNTFKDNYTDFKGFLDVINEEWLKIESNLKVLSENLYKKIYTFLLDTNPSEDYSWCSDGDINIGWSSIDGLEEWCNNGNDPFEFKLQKAYTIGDQTISTFKDVIALFKQEIQIRSENDILENIFKEKRKELYYFFKELNIKLEMDLINLQRKSFYTDTQVLNSVIDRIFKDIKKRVEFNKIKVELVEDENSKFYDLKITQIGSASGKSSKEMLDVVTGGDSSIIKKDLMHLCDWSIESNHHNENYRINYLTSSSNNEKETLDYIPEGFTYILRFYK